MRGEIGRATLRRWRARFARRHAHVGELASYLRRIARLRLASVVLVVGTVLAAAVLVAGPTPLRAATWLRDPGFAALDALPLPRWASGAPTDSAAGSRWCLDRCRVRQRQWTSTEDVAVTAAAFRVALADEGWRRMPRSRCASSGPGIAHCFVRDGWQLRLMARPLAEAPGTVVTAVVAARAAPD